MFWLRSKTLSGPYGESSPTLLTAAAERGLGSLATTSTGSCGRLALGAGSGLLLPGESDSTPHGSAAPPQTRKQR
jgi:hypothetical protein